MGAFLIYLSKSAVVMVLFYLFNRLFISRDTIHKFNRALWLSTIVVSLLLPFLNFDFFSFYNDSPVLESIDSDEIITSSIVSDVPDSLLLKKVVIYLFIIYIIGVLITLTLKIVSFLKMIAFISRKYKSSTEFDQLLQDCSILLNCRNTKLLVHSSNLLPFSWMNIIVVSKRDLIENGREILIHEISHIKGGHSWDIIIADLMIIFQWFNPAAWLLKRSIQQVHEYIVDEEVINSGIDAKSYQLLLIKKAVGQCFYPVANSFNHSKLKNRITMMLKEKSNKWAYAKCLYAIPVAFLVISLFCTPKISAKIIEISKIKVTNLSDANDNALMFNHNIDSQQEKSVVYSLPDNVSDDPVPYAKIEDKPTFNGGDPSVFSQWVMSNVIYPADAMKNKKQGRVTLQFTVDIDGSVKDVKVLRGVDQSLDNEALRVISASPKWSPGKIKGKEVPVIFIFPVIFQLK